MKSASHTVMLEDRALLRVGGPDAAPFLQGLMSCDVRKVTEHHATLGALLSPQGKFLFDFFLLRRGEEFLLDTEASRLEALQKKLSMYRLRAAVEIAPLPECCVMAALEALPESGEVVRCIPDPRHAQMGWRLYGPAGALPEVTGNREEYERRRITLGLPDGSRDAEIERTLLLENGYDQLGGVDFAKGCYVGQEVTARSKHRGQLRKYLYIVTGQKDLPPPGTELMAHEQKIGVLRSTQGDMGLALVQVEHYAVAQATHTPIFAADCRVELRAPWWLASEISRKKE